MNIGNIRVSTRLIVGFGLVLSLLILVTLLGINRMATIQQQMEDITKINDVESRLASTMYLSVTERALALRNLILLKEESEIAQEVNRITQQTKRYKDAQDQLESMLSKERTPASAQMSLFNEIKEQAKLAEPFIERGSQLSQDKKKDEAYQLLRFEFRPVQKKWWDLLSDFIKLQEKQNQQVITEAENVYSGARFLMLSFGLIALLAGIAASIIITRSLLQQLGGEPQYAVEIADSIAAGDLSVEIRLRPNDQSSLLHAMRAMRDSLSDIVGKVRTGTDTIATASGQIATGNLDLSSRTEQQAGSLEETASSMEQLTSTVKQNSENAKQANQLALSASQVAIKGGDVVSKVVHTMGSINDSSRKIVDIIAVIDGIAFQTNILALNAAVEAARAGEEGRGFAVVATEVRSLAQRSANAAKEIKDLISSSVNKVEEGSKLVDEAGATMSQIVTSIQSVTDIMNEIMMASREQSQGIEQVNEAIMSMDDVTQQNAALVEEAAAAATALQDQATTLAGLVSTFKLDGNQQSQSLAATMPANIPKEKLVPIVKKAAANAADINVRSVKRIANSKSASDAEWDEF